MENKKEEEINKEKNKDFSLEIPYTIRTMDSDLKKEDSKMSSFKINERSEKEGEEEKKKKIEEKEKEIEKKPPLQPKSQKDFNPFLDDLAPNPHNPISQTQSETKSSPNLPPLKSDKTPSNQIPPKTIKKNNPGALEKAKEENKSNSFTLVMLLVVSLITIGSGFYYFFYLKKDLSNQVITTEEENHSTDDQSKDKLVESSSIESSILALNNEEELLDKLKAKTNEITQSSNFKIEENNQIVNPEDLLSKLNVNLPQELLSEINKTWINLNKEKEALKLGLVFEINNSQKVESILLGSEPFLPEMLSSLFIDEAFVLQEENISFRDSDELEGVRYYNLVKGFNDKAIDWKIQNNKYLLITTSQETMADLISKLENSQIKTDEEKVKEVENQEMPGNEIEIETN